MYDPYGLVRRYENYPAQHLVYSTDDLSIHWPTPVSGPFCNRRTILISSRAPMPLYLNTIARPTVVH